MVVAIALLVVFQNVTKMMQALETSGDVPAGLGMWALCAIYFAIGLWLYITTTSQGSGSPAQTMFVWVDRGIRQMRAFVMRRLGKPEEGPA